MYYSGDRVRVHQGDFIYDGVINCSADPSFGYCDYYWVDYWDHDGVKRTSIFNESDLAEWNKKSPCDCGAKAVGVPDNDRERHSYYCRLK